MAYQATSRAMAGPYRVDYAIGQNIGIWNLIMGLIKGLDHLVSLVLDYGEYTRWDGLPLL